MILSKGVEYCCTYDDIDQGLVEQYKWSVDKGYVRSRHLYLHRLILGITDPKIQVDHIDHNPFNNQRSNLRLCSHSENQRNRIKRNGSSVFKGVTRRRGRFAASITYENRKYYLGLFRSEITAAKVYDNASTKLHGEFGLTNFPIIDKEPVQLRLNFKPHQTFKKTSIQLIEKAVNYGWIKQLAFYHILKLRFNNSCIYRYKSRMLELSLLYNISVRTMYNYLNKLKDVGLVFDHGPNLVLRSIHENTCHNKCVIKINNHHSISDVSCLLYGKLIEKNAKKQAFAESLRRFGRGDKIKSRLCENPFLPSISCRTAAKILKVSEFKAFNILKNLDRMDVIKVSPQKPRLVSNDFIKLDVIEDLPGYRFNIGTRLFEQYGYKMEFLQFPITLPRINAKMFNRLNHMRLQKI